MGRTKLTEVMEQTKKKISQKFFIAKFNGKRQKRRRADDNEMYLNSKKFRK